MDYESVYQQASELITRIKDKAAHRDHEAAHGLEDDLRELVLKAIFADGVCDIDMARSLAGLALSTKDIAFQRWCA